MEPSPQNTMHRILRILERDARMAHADVAAMAGTDVAEVARVVQECEARGIIRRYKTVVDWERAGAESVEALIEVRVSPAREVGFDDVAARIYRYPEVIAVLLVSGGYDLHVVVRGPTFKDVAMFVAEKLATLDRVNSTATHFLLRRYKLDGDILVEQDEDRRLAVTP